MTFDVFTNEFAELFCNDNTVPNDARFNDDYESYLI